VGCPWFAVIVPRSLFQQDAGVRDAGEHGQRLSLPFDGRRPYGAWPWRRSIRSAKAPPPASWGNHITSGTGAPLGSAISLIDLPLTRCSRRIRPIVSITSIPRHPLETKGSPTAQESGGSILDADPPAQGVKFAGRNTHSVRPQIAASLSLLAMMNRCRRILRHRSTLPSLPVCTQRSGKSGSKGARSAVINYCHLRLEAQTRPAATPAKRQHMPRWCGC
jgi:hypothetical protein